MTTRPVIVAHDVGTSGVKSVVADVNGAVLAKRTVGYPTQFPRPGWAEQEATDWWAAVREGTRAVVDTAGVDPGTVAGLTFTTQMLGLVALDADGGVVRRPIIWLDGRAGEQAAAVMRRFGGPRLFGRFAGATLSGKDGIPKLLWLRDEEPSTWSAMACFLDVGGYLGYRCTGRVAMDWTEASTYGLDLRRRTWLTRVMRYAGVPSRKLPPLVPPNTVLGPLTRAPADDLGLRAGTPVLAGMGDAPAASVGAGAVRPGDAHVYLGTSGWVGVLVDGHPTGRHGIAVLASGDPAHNLLIAEMETGGQCIRWVADELYRARGDDYDEVFRVMDRDAERVPPGSQSLLFTPWMYGERVPVTDPLLRSAFVNLGAGHHRETLVRAVLEGVSFNYRWVLERLDHDFRLAPRELRVVGGGARSAVWMQVLADVTGRRVETVAEPQDAGAVGAALGAAVALGVQPDFAGLRSVVALGPSYEPRAENRTVYDALYREYRHAYRRLRGLYHELNERPVA